MLTSLVLTAALAPWFQGTPTAAFAKAKAEGKPILVYWGAVWCPPCNELKAQVFEKPRFGELTKPLVAAYLDGDEAEAQLWGEKLGISGYPTVLLLAKDGSELMRFNEAVTFEEFEAALSGALAAGGPVKGLLTKAAAEPPQALTTDEWRTLAYFSWYQADKLGLEAKDLLSARAKLPLRVPETMKAERALLAAQALTAFAEAKDEARKADAFLMLEMVLASPETIRAARSTILYAANDVVSWAWPEGHPERARIIARWLTAGDQLAADATLSPDARLWALNPRVELAKGEATTATVRAGAKLADERSKTPYERTATISGASYLLRQVGDFAGARALLDKELKTTKTPWYYQSSYASLEKAAGREAEALKWSKKARESVKGRASRVQWIVEDLVLSAKLEYKGKDARLAEVTKLYYDEALALPDGFAGRNAARAKKVVEALKPHAALPDVKKTLATYGAKCREKKGCTEHFKELVPGV